jgi:hypothetical protein
MPPSYSFDHPQPHAAGGPNSTLSPQRAWRLYSENVVRGVAPYPLFLSHLRLAASRSRGTKEEWVTLAACPLSFGRLRGGLRRCSGLPRHPRRSWPSRRPAAPPNRAPKRPRLFGTHRQSQPSPTAVSAARTPEARNPPRKRVNSSALLALATWLGGSGYALRTRERNS